ncbi:J domain-containing protein [Sphingobacterium detergens]|uniref:DnaJ-like protein n=1 Tax=Sphingobacterium detergens TaxID=1145106 RepID=A0A420ARU7_SPHD1|nr:J domain-containing protein [Sphingobacterium detergens]RKE47147.1 DnaJ-like protein [Sphingobacterium detergens]
MAKKGFLDGYKTYDTSQGYGSSKKWRSAFNERFSKQEAETIIGNEKQTPYQILGIKHGATKSEIKKAFRALVTEWHPDLNQHRLQEAEEMSKKIIAAYSLLSK